MSDNEPQVATIALTEWLDLKAENKRLREELDDLRADLTNLYIGYDKLMQERGP